uniref:NADH-ubiquinone oxidoreductase chain 2 n=1 Tax=Melanoides tuberculata TaxID=55729 RepID=A0A8F6D5I1_MELTU|nr:NADH dehydrogenase subunit 2 [Melanoides tuberculata]
MFSSLPFSLMFFIMMIFGTLFSISSSHWLGIWAGLEINLIGFLPILMYQKSMLESESAVKYFIIQALGSSFLIFGSLFSYSLSFSWEFLAQNLMIFLFGTFFLVLGLFLKMGLFPFHFWLPNVMAGLSWLSCLLLTTWQKVAPILLITCITDANLAYTIFFIICVFSVGSSLVGGVGGMNQTQIRALLAYSSIGHVGWIVYASCFSESGMKIYFLIYAIISICIFLSLWVADLGNLKNLGSVGKAAVKSKFSFMLVLLSLGGLPPLLGFISKWIVISMSMSANAWGFLFILILGSLFSLFYYLNLFFSETLALKFNFMGSFSLSYGLGILTSSILLINLLGGMMLILFLPLVSN